jgi:hypothetical protein
MSGYPSQLEHHLARLDPEEVWVIVQGHRPNAGSVNSDKIDEYVLDESAPTTA